MSKLISSVKEFFKHDVEPFDGFVSAKFHADDERKIFINYATWKSKESYQEFLETIASTSARGKKVKAFNPKGYQVYHLEDL